MTNPSWSGMILPQRLLLDKKNLGDIVFIQAKWGFGEGRELQGQVLGNINQSLTKPLLYKELLPQANFCSCMIVARDQRRDRLYRFLSYLPNTQN